MADRTHSFSIYLLKEGVDADGGLDADHALVETKGALAPRGSRLFVFDRRPKAPWWRDYFGMSEDLDQVLKGAILFLPLGQRVFALTFGGVAHFLDEEFYEHDFGLRVTLNCVDPSRLKNTDILERGAARRQRTQVAVSSDLTFFDFDRDSKVMRSLTGAVEDQYQEYFKQATGAASLRVATKFRSGDLGRLCAELLRLYESDRYKATFPDVQNIAPVKDPVKVAELDAALLEKFQARSPEFSVSFPSLLDYADETLFRFSGVGVGMEYEDLRRELVYEYLDGAGVDPTSIDLDGLKRLRINVVAEGSGARSSASLYRAIVMDIDDPADRSVYHLSEGDWYRFEADYVHRIIRYLDERFDDLTLPACTKHREDEYNVDASAQTGHINLDKTNISPSGQSNIEPCDLLKVQEQHVELVHVKISTTSDKLSHLFNQGVNSARLLLGDVDALEKLVSLVRVRSSSAVADVAETAFKARRFKVKYAMITHKNPEARSLNLPLFSRVSLMRAVKELELLGVEVVFGFVPDKSPDRAGKPHERKKRSSSSVQFVDESGAPSSGS